MNRKNLLHLLIIGASLTTSLTTAPAQLPAWQEKPWLGYFVGSDRRTFAIGINPDGVIELEIKSSNGTRMGFSKAILIAPTVMAESEKGWTTLQKVKDSLSTTDKATDKPTKVTYRGKVTGGVEYEVIVEFDRDKISFGGRIVDKGTTTKPLKFQTRCRFQQPYQRVDPDKEKAKLSKDKIKFVRIDKKKDSCGIIDSVNFADAEKFGPLSAVEVEMYAYGKPRLLFSSSGRTPIVLQNPNFEPLSPMKGFVIALEHDPVKDPNGNDRLIFEAK